MKIPKSEFDPLVEYADLVILSTIKLLDECNKAAKRHGVDPVDVRKAAINKALARNFGASLDLDTLPIGGNA